MKVLIVDDNPDLTYDLGKELRFNGYETDNYSDAGLVLALDASQYNVAVIDIRTPDMNSFELARRLWQQNENMQICFLATFDIQGEEAKKLLPSLKSHCFVTKPISASELAEHIQSHFKNTSTSQA